MPPHKPVVVVVVTVLVVTVVVVAVVVVTVVVVAVIDVVVVVEQSTLHKTGHVALRASPETGLLHRSAS